MLESIETVMAVGSFWFWIVIVGAMIACSVLLEIPSKYKDVTLFPVFFVTIIVSACFYITGPLKDLFYYVIEHKVMSVILILCYFATGCVYSMIKFWSFLDNIRSKYFEFRESWIVCKKGFFPQGAFDKDVDIKTLPIPSELKEKWIADIKYNDREMYDYASGDLTVANYKSAITSWIIYWPLSGLWFLINDPIKRFANYLYSQFKHIYSKIYQSSRGKINDDFT